MEDCLVKVLLEVPGWLTTDEAELLFSLTRDWEAPGQCVELGAYQGHSTICMALALDARAHSSDLLLSIDKHSGSAEHQLGGSAFDLSTLDDHGSVNTEHLLRKHLETFQVMHRVVVKVSDTRDAGVNFSQPIRLLFVDADHELNKVREDIAAWEAHVSPAGCIVLHDVGGWPGPTIVAGELLASGYTRVEQAGTLLALRKPSPEEHLQ